MLTKALRLLPIIIFLPLSLIAQTYPRMEACGGFQSLWEPHHLYGGFKVEAAANINRHFAVVGEFGYGSNTKRAEGFTFIDKRQTYLAGPRINIPINRFRIVSQILFGAHHWSYRYHGLLSWDQNYIDQTEASTSFAFSAGAGIELALNDRFSVRVAQMDLLETRVKEFMGATLTQGTWVPFYRNLWEDKMRFSAGVVFKFGKTGKS